jgi:release factor glutamine methyltransferase
VSRVIAGEADAEAGAPRRAWSVLELLRWTTAHFAQRGIESARLDAECLLAHALGVTRLRLYLDFDKPIHESERAVFRDLVRQRAAQRIPVSQLTGRREFWSLPLRVTRDVLTPRPETETLVEAALGLLPQGNGAARPPEILDLGTGSGAIALALARERPDARITASDLSPAALSIAQQNAEELGMADRITFLAGDGFAAPAGARFDLVVSNPPYLDPAERDVLPPELAHEPECALFAADGGLGMLRRLAREAPGWLRPEGALALEHAPDQARPVEQALAAAGFSRLAVHRDLCGNPRVTTARLGAAAAARD